MHNKRNIQTGGLDRSRRRRLLNAVAAALAITVLSPVASAIDRGTPLPASEGAYSVRMVDVASMESSRCTATKIGRRTFLTAAHCAAPLLVGQSLALGLGLHNVISIDLMSGPELETSGLRSIVSDIAVFEIADDTENIPIAHVTSQINERINETPVFVAGFATQEFLAPIKEGLLAKASATRAPTLLLLSHPILFGGKLKSGNLRPGDSGSALLRAYRDENGSWQPSDEILGVVCAIPEGSVKALARASLFDLNRYHGIAVRLDRAETRAWIENHVDRRAL